MEFYTTGEVARKLDVSVRTLRYYDQIGLLSPSEKESTGKRLYNENDLLELEKITILKMLHLSLEDIGKILSRVTTKQLLQAHKKSLQLKLSETNQSIQHTNMLLNIIQAEGDLNWEQLLSVVHEAKQRENPNQNWHEFFTEEEAEELKEKLPKMEQDSVQIKQWINLIRRIEGCIKRGDTPDSEEGQIIAEDALLLSNELFAGNEALGEKFLEIRKSEEKSQSINLYPVKKEVLQFVETAIEIYEKTKSST